MNWSCPTHEIIEDDHNNNRNFSKFVKGVTEALQGFLTKVAQMYGGYLAVFKNIAFQLKTTVATFWPLLVNIWVIFYSNIWPHWTWDCRESNILNCVAFRIGRKHSRHVQSIQTVFIIFFGPTVLHTSNGTILATFCEGFELQIWYNA